MQKSHVERRPGLEDRTGGWDATDSPDWRQAQKDRTAPLCHLQCLRFPPPGCACPPSLLQVLSRAFWARLCRACSLSQQLQPALESMRFSP